MTDRSRALAPSAREPWKILVTGLNRCGGPGVLQVVTVRGDARRDFFAANYPRLAGWVRRQVADDETAHDIAAEAFTRLLSRWSDSYDPHAYLYKIAVNLLRDHWRRSLRERHTLALVAADQRDGPDGRPERGGDLRALLAPLPEHQRTALLLHYLAGFSVREVSAIVGRPEGTVKSDLFHARARIRADLDGTDD